ncbi:alpha/beta fold hydrolase [Polaromonas sp. UC242_47]|uniref:alpha/beta fold hydrolase n=1 Tax=Polaromonas sp. UC242_47 TaxID=3374626 RepID=UPI0037AC6DAB
MPQLHFIQQGQGPTVVLSHALGCDLQMWDEVATALQARYTVLRYDHRGHGQSPASSGAFNMDDLADDAAALIRQQVQGPVHFVGLSMGGMTAQALAARHPALVRSITVANSAASYDAAAKAGWQTRIDTVLAQGMAAIADGALLRWFTPEFRADAQGSLRVAALRAVLLGTAPVPYAASCAAVAGIALDESNRRITCPALVIAGTRDEATPPALSEAIARNIPGAQLASLDASHLSAVERPAEFAQLLARFFSAH